MRLVQATYCLVSTVLLLRRPAVTYSGVPLLLDLFAAAARVRAAVCHPPLGPASCHDMVRVKLFGVTGTAAGPSTDGGSPKFVSEIDINRRQILIQCANYPLHRQFIQLPEGWTFKWPEEVVEVHADQLWLVDCEDRMFVHQEALLTKKGWFPAACLEACIVEKLTGQSFKDADEVFKEIHDGSLSELDWEGHECVPLFKVWGKNEYVKADIGPKLLFRRH